MAKMKSRPSQGQQARQKGPAQATESTRAAEVQQETVAPIVEENPLAQPELEEQQAVEAEEETQRQQALQVREEQKPAVAEITYPAWPTSRPGPRATPPPPGMRPINAIRPEQVAEIGYNQETGEPGNDSLLRSLPDENIVGRGQTSFDQPRTAQEEVGKRKKRL